MYSKALCEWFLTDGIYPPVRLDAPEYIEDALTEAGVLGIGLPVEERCRNEWIYRRTWRYLTQFTLPDTEKRVFMRLSGLKGKWRLTVNGALAAEGEDSWCETEITGLLGVPNYLEIAFLPDDSFSLFPQAGFKRVRPFNLAGIKRFFIHRAEAEKHPDPALFAGMRERVDAFDKGLIRPCRIKPQRRVPIITAGHSVFRPQSGRDIAMWRAARRRYRKRSRHSWKETILRT